MSTAAKDGQRFSPYGVLYGVFVPVALLEAGISHGAAMAYAKLAAYDVRRRGVVWPSQAALARDLRCSERSVRDYLRELKTAGLISTSRRGTKKGRIGRSAQITFHSPEWITRGLRTDRQKTAGQSSSDRQKTAGQSRPPLMSRARGLEEVRQQRRKSAGSRRGESLFAEQGNRKNQRAIGTMVSDLTKHFSGG